MFRFPEHFVETVQERCQPEEPFEESCQHHGSHDGNVDDLFPISANLSTLFLDLQRTSALGHGAVIAGIPVSPAMMDDQGGVLGPGEVERLLEEVEVNGSESLQLRSRRAGAEKYADSEVGENAHYVHNNDQPRGA